MEHPVRNQKGQVVPMDSSVEIMVDLVIEYTEGTDNSQNKPKEKSSNQIL